MAEPTVVCPQCKAEIKLTESLAAPLLESIRRDYEQRLTQKDADIAKREQTLHEREAVLQKQKESMDEQVAQKIQQEQARIGAEEAKKAKLAVGNELNQKVKEINDLQDILKQRDIKLADAQKAQADLIRKQRELDDAKRELELTVEKRVETGLAAAREKAKKEAEDEMKLKVMEAEQTIASMQRQIEDLKRRAEQGSQQLQGEVQELELEAQDFRATQSSPSQRVNSAATSSIGSSAPSASSAAQSSGNRKEPRIGAMAGYRSCAKINAPPKLRSPSSSVRSFPKTWKHSA